MAEHTPGPWIAREWECHAPTTIGVEIDGRFAPIATAKSADGYYGKPEAVANARLIAAAPDLLEALECLLPGLILDLRYATDDDDKDAMRSRIKTVTDALAKTLVLSASTSSTQE